MTRSELTEMYRAYLAEEGYVPHMEDNGDVTFKFEGGLYILMVAEDDPEYFRLAYPGFWEIENEEERLRVNQAALQACIDIKVAKVYPLGDNTWAAVELFCNPPDNFKSVLQRSLRAIQSAVDCFSDHLRNSR